MSHIPENPNLPGPRPRRRPKVVPLKPKEEKLLAGRMAAERVLRGQTIAAIAEKYQTAPGRVRRLLDYAEKNNLLEHYRAGMFEDLLPKAIAVYEKHLEAGNLEAARDIVQGLGVLNPKNQPLAPGEQEETLEVYRLRRRLAQQTASSLDMQAGSPSVVVDAITTVEERPAENREGPLELGISEGVGSPNPETPPVSGPEGGK